MFYSPETKGFYSSEIHGNSLPADVVEITAEEHAALLDGQSIGKIISADADGRPMLMDPPAPTTEQLQAQINADARAYLASTDWYVLRLQETGQEIPPDVLAERAAARARVVE